MKAWLVMRMVHPVMVQNDKPMDFRCDMPKGFVGILPLYRNKRDAYKAHGKDAQLVRVDVGGKPQATPCKPLPEGWIATNPPRCAECGGPLPQNMAAVCDKNVSGVARLFCDKACWRQWYRKGNGRA